MPKIGYRYQEVMLVSPLLKALGSSSKPLRFGEIRSSDVYKIRSPASLSRYLKKAQILGLVNRKVENVPGKPLDVSYELTSDGREAYECVIKLDKIVKK